MNLLNEGAGYAYTYLATSFYYIKNRAVNKYRTRKVKIYE